LEAYLRAHPDPALGRRWLGSARPALIRFWYRESPQPLVPAEVFAELAPGMVSRRDPPMETAGMYTILLDTKGRPIQFDLVPQLLEENTHAGARPDPDALWSAAGLDATGLSAADSKWVPNVAFDSRMTWIGTFLGHPEMPIRVEAAWWRGKPVSFQLIGPWTRPGRDEPSVLSAGERISIVLALLFGMLGASSLLAWRHLRSGRGERRGAFRLAAVVFVCDLSEWLLAGSHTATFGEAGVFALACAWSLLQAVFIWTMYMALEPYVRCYWPHSIISLTRLLSGAYGDAAVGADLLVGIVEEQA
jgi:hypothetical protein